MRNYMGFVRDHSGSMSSLARRAMTEYNTTLIAVRDAAIEHYLDTFVSVVKCCDGARAVAVPEIDNKSIIAVRPITDYPALGGGTPLWDSVGLLIEMLEKVPDAKDPEVTFVVNVDTDGLENASTHYNARTLAAHIARLQATDRWTFSFRVPLGKSHHLQSLGIPANNILEWGQTQEGAAQAAQKTREAVKNFYSLRSQGVTSTKRFYADLSNVTSKDVQQTMKDISPEVHIWPVSVKDDGKMIKDFVEGRISSYLKGAAFYQLSKPENIQDHKRIIIRDKTSNAVYEGAAARHMLGLPAFGSVRASPGNTGNFDLFIQSTSVNRKLVKGTNVVYWPPAVR